VTRAAVLDIFFGLAVVPPAALICPVVARSYTISLDGVPTGVFFFGLDFSKGLETHTRRKDRASIPEHQGFADMAPNNRIASIA